ncbi:T9SS sorting signal type C domain-containing protein [Flavobacterium sp.]
MKISIKLLLVLFITHTVSSQTTVFSDDFNTTTDANYTRVNGPIGTSSVWNVTKYGSDFGAKLNGFMYLSNDASAAANSLGWVLAQTSTSNFLAPYNSVLGSNPGLVTWTFNMRQIRTNPNGFNDGNYGVAMILAGTPGTTNASGTGYAVTLGNTGTIDPIRLVKYTAGLRTSTVLKASNTSGLTDFGKDYISIKVTYDPSNNQWQLFLRKDGTVSFADPLVGNLVSQGTVIDNTYTSANLSLYGSYWNAGSRAVQTAFFDNFTVSVVTPTITSIAPSSAIAGTGSFTLTVNGENFINGVSKIRWGGIVKTTTFVSTTKLTTTILAADILSPGYVDVTVSNGAAVSDTEVFSIDPSGAPTVSVSTSSLPRFTTVTGTGSSNLSYTVSGANLTNDVIVTPSSNFEVSLNGTTFSNSLTLGRTGYALTGQPVTIYTRIKATALPGVYAATANTHTTTGGVTKNVNVAATVYSTKPTTQPTGISFTNVTSTSFKVNWATNGNGTKRIVLIKAVSAVNSSPAMGVSYLANASFGTGTELGTGNFVFYADTGNAAVVTDLDPNSIYYVAVYEYNGAAGTENYYTTSPLTGNKTTLNAPAGLQILAANTPTTINFDTTVDGVNNNKYIGDGLASNPSNGQLNSKAWAITGLSSDGTFNFGEDSVGETVFDGGASDGSEEDGGLYAFQVSPNNAAFGIQPTAIDFNPGTLTLKIQNTTGATINSLSIGYKVYVYNDQASSTSFNFSHSLNNSAYTSVPNINFTSATTADDNPEWKAHYRVVTISGVTLTNNNYYYLRWTGTNVGAAPFDEIALDDITVIANPTTNFVAFDGTADTFIVDGNTSLSGNTTVNNELKFTNATGKLDIKANTLTIGGTVINSVAGGLKGGNTSTIIVAGTSNPTLSFDQTTVGTTNLLNNLSVNTTSNGIVTIANPLIINGTLTTAANQTLNMGTTALTGSLTTISNAGTIATQNTTALPLPTGKTWTGAGKIHYNATSSAQTIVPGIYNGLTISTTGGGVSSGNITVNGVLHLPAANPSATVGSLAMNTNTLTMGENGTNTGLGEVTGIITRTTFLPNVRYTYGHPNTSISFPNYGTLPTSLSLKTTIGTAPSWKTDGIKRFYDLIQTGAVDTRATLRTNYLDSELNGNAENKIVFWSKTPTITYEQGKSNFDSTANWVELTNANIALYFVGTFGNVFVTLGNSTAVTRTWTGATSTSFTTADNWFPVGTPTSDTDVIIPQNSPITPYGPIINNVILNAASTIKSLSIESGGIVNSYMGSDPFLYSNLTLSGGAGAWINNGTFNNQNSTITFTNATATIAGNTTFRNLTIGSGAGLSLLANAVTKIAGTLTNNGTLIAGNSNNTVEYTGIGQNIIAPNGDLSAYRNLIISGTAAIFPSTLTVSGNVILNQSVDFTGKSLLLKGTIAQTISGSSSPVFNNLIINNSLGDINLATNCEITGTLTLTNGRINLANANLTIGSNAIAGGTFSKDIMIYSNGGTGELRRKCTATGTYFYPIGAANLGQSQLEYAPITINITAGSFSNAYVGVKVNDGVHPDNKSVNNNISRYWSVTQSGITTAMATITANYIASDLTGVENTIAAAALKGSFNAMTNPWLKFGALSSNTLTATGVALTAGQVVVFTGLKGGTFTAPISGYGEFCLNATEVTLMAIPVGGDGPFTYSWSGGLGIEQTANPLTNTVGTTNYVVIVKDGNGITTTDNRDVTILSSTLGGTLPAEQHVCLNSIPNSITLTGYNGTILYWQKSTDSGFVTSENISNITNELTGTQFGTITGTTYYRAVVKNGTCDEKYSSITTIYIDTTTWNGSAWSNLAPTSSVAAIISGDYTASSNLEACSLLVSNNATVIIPSTFNVILNGSITVQPGSSFKLENNANLLQTTTVANTGNITVQRNSSLLKRLDYTLWSSPVSGSQTLKQFSPNTLDGRFYNYDSNLNVYATENPLSTTFGAATGHLIRTSNTHPTTATIWTGEFVGVPNNGNINFTLSDDGVGKRFNLVGNPYPSPISAVDFVNNSSNITKTLYFWRKTNNAASPSYSSWTSIGGFVTNGEAQVFDPNGIIRTGQGFFVEGNGAGTSLYFNNSMRRSDTGNQFFRTATTEIEKNRIWINLTNTDGAFSQTLVGYFTGATNDVDQNIDGKFINDGAVAINTLIDEVPYTIQGKGLPFDQNDTYPLNIKITTTGTYTISIDHVDGLFAGNQDIFLQDNETEVIHDLKANSYTFASQSGTFNNRFAIVYRNTTLGVSNPTVVNNQVIVYKSNGSIVINSTNELIKNVRLFDIRGRLIGAKDNVNNSTTLMVAPEENGILLVQIELENNKKVTKKIIN